ncbi:MAG: BamA/TamA family outer membrane protein, partial [Candidatus Latescibacterota bacterium]
SKTMDDPGTILGATNPYGTGDFWQTGLRIGLVHDSRNVPTWPTSGVLLDLEGAFYPEVFDIEDGSFRSLEGLASGVYSVFRFLALAGRIGAKGVWGNYPYWEAAYIGGVETVRGYQAQRFAGDGAVFAGLEARVPVSSGLGEFGLFGLLDTGRVFLDGESSNRWHTGYGGGAWLTPLFRQFTMSFSLADSREDTIFHFKIDTGF